MRTLLSALCVVSLFTACVTPGEPAGSLSQSDKARITTAAPRGHVAQSAEALNELGFDVYKKLATGDGNIAFSPWSIDTALALTYPGARSTTSDAMRKTMRIPLPDADFHRSMNDLTRSIDARNGNGTSTTGGPLTLRTTNQVFVEKSMTLLPDFLDVLAQEYGAGVRQVDFIEQPEPARVAINDWVKGETESLIPELLPKGIITSDTRLTLVNALYFNAAWKQPFNKGASEPGLFTKSDGTRTSATMMNSFNAPSRYANVNGVEALELPYSGDELGLLILAPQVGQLAAFEQTLNTSVVNGFVNALDAEQTRGVSVPRFEAKSQARLDEILKELGMSIAFESGADFTGIDGKPGLFISAVVHEAVVKVSEAGTEAAAATAVVVGRDSVPSFDVMIDRPFVYLVRDRSSGVVLFAGRVMAP
ncbi:MAG: serpin family protein [Archangium sp.]